MQYIKTKPASSIDTLTGLFNDLYYLYQNSTNQTTHFNSHLHKLV